MAADYDEVRPDVAEASEKTLKDVRKLDAPSAKSVHSELDEADVSEGLELPGAIVDEELAVDVIPQAEDEFVCVECFTIRHRSQAEEQATVGVVCRDCVLEYA